MGKKNSSGIELTDGQLAKIAEAASRVAIEEYHREAEKTSTEKTRSKKERKKEERKRRRSDSLVSLVKEPGDRYNEREIE